VTFFSAHQAWANFTPDIGARASLAGAQGLLVSPPIPNLEGGKTTYSPQVGYMISKVDGYENESNSGGPPLTINYTGDIKGISGAIGVSAPSYGRLAWFGIIGGDALTGDIDVTMSGAPFGFIRDIKTQSFAFAAGPSYRFTGDASSKFAAGAFLGPAAIKVNSTFDLSSNNTTYTLDDTIYGAYGGVQFKWRVDNSLVINPYALYMYELSPKCKKMSVTGGSGFTGLCPDDEITPNLVEMKSSFSGIGLYLGWKSFRLNVYSKAMSDAAFSDIKVTNYSVSYTIGN
jgi:hypothetical protein